MNHEPRLPRRALLGGAALLAAAPALAEEGLALLRRPFHHAIMRHARAPGVGDPAAFTLGDCATQRNLDEEGRRQARRVGDAYRAAGIGVETVLSSEWCRCMETAALLGLGSVQALPALNSVFRQSRAVGAEQSRAVAAVLAGLPGDRPAVLVSHQVNIDALVGRITASGETVILVVRDGRVEPVGAFSTP